MAERQKQYLNTPVRAGGRNAWLVSDNDTGELLGIRPQSAGNTLADAQNHSPDQMRTLTVRNRAVAEVGESYRELPLTEPDEHRALRPEIRQLPEFAWHDRRPAACPGCAADRVVKLGPALPQGTDLVA
jgi:hypothetical protein